MQDPDPSALLPIINEMEGAQIQDNSGLFVAYSSLEITMKVTNSPEQWFLNFFFFLCL